jgi:tetratricopeptide (TPR) repeat protein
MKTLSTILTIPFTLFFLSLTTLAQFTTESLDQKIDAIETNWGRTYYSAMTKDEKKKIYTDLISETEELIRTFPKTAEPIVWKGILVSNLASVIDRIAALNKIKEAKKHFEDSIAINPNALFGTAYINLGILYHEVPGWPVSFGNDSISEKMFKKALTVNPNSIDVNLYYGKFLEDKDRKQEALLYFKKAVSLNPRPNQIFIDQKLKEEANEHLKKLTFTDVTNSNFDI